MKRFKVAPEIYYEKSAIDRLAMIPGKKAFIVTDKMMVTIGLVEKITRILDSRMMRYEIFDAVLPDPTVDVVTQGFEQYVRSGADLLIALGGGSVIDAAKAIVYFTKEMETSGKNEGIDVQSPYFVAIPTTSGTGSEVTSYTVITDTKQGIKVTIKDDEKFPDMALLDCDLIKSVPPSVTADTGMDVLAHAIESYVCNECSDYTDALAEKAIEFIFEYLVACYNNGSDEYAREKVHNASCMAGMAFENAALGINHSLAHAIGARFKISHGKANAILMPYVIRFNSGLFDYDTPVDFKAAKKYSKLARMLELPASDMREGVAMLAKSVMALNNDMHIPFSLKELEINWSDFEHALPELAKNALEDVCTAGNPRRVDEDDLKAILLQAYNGIRQDGFQRREF